MIAKLLLLAAVLPAVYLLVQVYRSDRIEKEPVALILSLIGFGILAVFCSMVTESLGSRIADEHKKYLKTLKVTRKIK